MCWIRLSEPSEVHDVALRMRQRDYDEISCLRWSDTREELANDLIHAFADFQNIYTIGRDDENIAIIAYVPLRKGVWSLGMFATDNFQKVGKFLTKRIIRDIIPSLSAAKAHRIEAQSISGYDEVHKWLKFLGLKEEAKLNGFGKNGEDFVQFSWVRSGGMEWKSAGVVS